MKKVLPVALLLIVSVISFIFLANKQNDKKFSETGLKVEALLEKMTLEEKVGEMTQLTIDMILKDGSNTEIDTSKLKDVLLNKHVGSILNVSGHAYPIELWHSIQTTIQNTALQKPNKIPVLFGIDAIHGCNYTTDATIFPHNIGMAATRDDQLVYEAAAITALETRASGIRWNFDPVFGIGRQPLWSRFEETFGEDVHIVSNMASAAVKAYEGDDLKDPKYVASCMKHFLGYTFPLSGKDRTPAYIPEYLLRTYFLPPFEEAVKAGSSTVMINSGEINGVPVHASRYYLTTILREELGFEGLAVSDWEDIRRLHDRHRVAKDYKEAAMIAVNAGVDMSMVPYHFDFTQNVIELVKEGKISENRIDEAVGRILKLKYELGLFDNPFPEEEAKNNFGKPEYKDVALRSAASSITLLKNDEFKNQHALLPLKPNTKVLLAGPSANNLTSLHGSWSFVWQGDQPQHYPSTTISIKQALENHLGKNMVICSSKTDYKHPDNFSVSLLKKDAQNADLIVLCLGEESYAEQPGSINDLTLEENQIELAKAAIETGKPVILLLLEGRPRIISDIEPSIPAIVQAYRPGCEGANAIAKILTGEYNPSGKLPYTYPRHSHDLVPYDHKFTDEINEVQPNQTSFTGHHPQWPFGHGLSYTAFEYAELKLDRSTLSENDELTVTLKVTNVGKRDGDHAIDLYIRDLFASTTPPVKSLKRYKKVFLKAGESTTITFTILNKDLSIINRAGKRVVETGDFEIIVGDLKAPFSYNGKVQ